MQDGRRGLQRQRGRDGGYGANRFRRKTRGVFINSSKAILKKGSQALTICNSICIRVTTVLLYEYRYLIGHISAVRSVYATSYNSWYTLLVLMLMFDGGVHMMFDGGVHN